MQGAQRAMPGGRRVQSIQSLNPYMGSTWTIRARVASKGTMRTYTNAKGEGNLFNVEFIDEDGTRIEATLWREVAQKYFEVLEEGKVSAIKKGAEAMHGSRRLFCFLNDNFGLQVYYISKAGLKPTNKTYSSIPNDYQLLIFDRTEIEECKDASAEHLQKVQVIQAFLVSERGLLLTAVCFVLLSPNCTSPRSLTFPSTSAAA